MCCRVSAALFVATFLPLTPLAAADGLVTFKDLRRVKAGDRERTESRQTDSTQITVTANGRSDRQANSSSHTATYVVDYLGTAANPYAKLIVDFERATLRTDGRMPALKLDGQKLVMERRKDKTGYRMGTGNEVGEQQHEFLRREFSDDPTEESVSGGSLISAFWPKKPVAVKDSWPCDTDLLAKQTLSAFEGLTLDPAKSRGQSTLVKTYDLGGVRYAHMKVEAKLAVLRSESKDTVMTFNPPLVVEFTGTYDACIDGTTGNMTGDVSWTARGTASLKSKTEGPSTLKIDISAVTFKKYTLLPKK